MSTNQQSRKHHYIPAFYLRRWVGDDGALQVFCRPHHELVSRRRAPSATGFEVDLYTLPNLSNDQTNYIEDRIFSYVDQQASLALDALHDLAAKRRAEMPGQLRSAWSRLLISLHHRSPVNLAALKLRAKSALDERLRFVDATYDQFRRPGDPQTFAEAKLLFDDQWFDQFFALLIASLLDSELIGSHLNGMQQTIIQLPSSTSEFLTSDRPSIRTTALVGDQSRFLIPIGPRLLFVAVNNTAAFNEIDQMDRKDLVRFINDSVCMSAERFVYSTDEMQLRFVDNRLGSGLTIATRR